MKDNITASEKHLLAAIILLAIAEMMTLGLVAGLLTGRP